MHTRRRFISIIVAGTGFFSPFGSWSAVARSVRPERRWRGSALGADADILFFHCDPEASKRLLDDCLTEIRRIESVFSLNDPRSELSRLNRDGLLQRPSQDLETVLAAARALHRITYGAFDPTVQALWTLYHRHFSLAGSGSGGPPISAIQEALRRVDFEAVAISEAGIAFSRPGMAMTLNGIAQGYLTDRVASVLARGGVKHALIETGETYALGDRGDGTAWRIGIMQPRTSSLSRVVPLTDRAIATSAPAATTFDRRGTFHHLFDPRTGRSSSLYDCVSVMAPTAMLADGLSTAFATMLPDAVSDCVNTLPGVAAIVAPGDGPLRQFGPI